MKNYDEIIQDLIVNIKSNTDKITDFYEGSVIYSILQAFAIEIEGLYSFINTKIQTDVIDNILEFFGITPLPASPSGGNVTFYRDPSYTDDITIPYYTKVSANTEYGDIYFHTTKEVTLTNGVNEIDVPVECELLGEIGNVNENTITNLADTITGIDHITNQQKFTNGKNEETKEEQKIRFYTYLNSLSKGTKTAIKNEIITIPDIKDVFIVENQSATVFVYNSSTTDFTNYTNEASNQFEGIFTMPNNIDDILYIGLPFTFNFANIHLDVNGSKSSTVGVWEYYGNGQWNSLTITTDNTNEITQSGTLEFNVPSDWEKTEINDISNYYIRFRLTGNYDTQAKIDYITLPPAFGKIYIIAYDSTYSLTPDNINLITQKLENVIASGITYEIKAVEMIDFNIEINVEIQQGFEFSILQDIIEKNLYNYFSDNPKISEPVKIADIINIVMNIRGVENVKVVTPSTDIPAEYTKKYKLNSITINEV